MSFEIVLRAWVRLHDRGINAALILPANHLLFRAIQTEDTTFAKMRVRIDYFCLSHKPLLLLV
jgi:type IV secretory pathway VirB3-like protein